LAFHLLERLSGSPTGARAAGLDDRRSAMPAYENILADDEIIAVLS
jgi:hypothetical protein